jgi:putative pyrroloquinoline-quinone binding quinoprotein
MTFSPRRTRRALTVAITVATTATILAPWANSAGAHPAVNGPAGQANQATPTAAAPTPKAAAAGYADWDTYHGNRQRTGYAPTLKTVTSTPKSVWSLTLDGAVYGSPITVAGGVKIVATENNTVYRISENKVVWRHHLGAPVPLSSLPCGNINPLGITGTPTYDPSTRTIIVVAELANPFRHVAVGLNPSTGAQRWYRTVDVPSSVAGITPRAMQQRGALLVSGRRVYVPYGGLAGDCSSYKGSVVGLDLDHPGTAALWHFTVPTTREAGIWTPPGPSENPGGGLLVSVGNGETGNNGPYDFSDSVLKISSEHIVDSFSPSTWRSDNLNDLDLGSQGPAIMGSRVFIAGKSGTVYVLNRSALGGIGGQVSQRTDLNCRSFGGTAVLGNVVYVPCTNGVRAIRVNADGSMTALWQAPSNITGSPVIGGGRLWVLDTGAGRLHLLNPTTGADQLSLSVGAVNRFATPALYGNAVFVGTLSGIRAFNW